MSSYAQTKQIVQPLRRGATTTVNEENIQILNLVAKLSHSVLNFHFKNVALKGLFTCFKVTVNQKKL